MHSTSFIMTYLKNLNNYKTKISILFLVWVIMNELLRNIALGKNNESIRFRNNYTTVTNGISESGRRVNANYVRSGSPHR